MKAGTDIFRQLAEKYAQAAVLAPALNKRFENANFNPREIASLEELSRLPVLAKEELLNLQRQTPPFGGFLAAKPEDLSRIYVSPGPIFEPSLHGNKDGHGLDLLFRAAGTGPFDVVLNTWSYHLVPAGLLFEEAAQAVDATVIPAGIGNRELQAQIIVETGVTAVCASTAFFVALADTVIDKFGKDAWNVKTAFLGGEMGDWMAKRRLIEEKYNVSTWAAYATADLGMVAYEDGKGEGYIVYPRRIVQICDPVPGTPVPIGETGEIVVTTLDAAWPMIRFGTGDSAFALEQAKDGRVIRLSALQGRVGSAVKVREIFVYPRAIEEVVIAVPEIDRAQGIVRQENGRDTIVLQIVSFPGSNHQTIENDVKQAFEKVARIRLDKVNFVEEQALPDDAELLVNRKD